MFYEFATDHPGVTLLRELVPEFEPTFRFEVEEEDGELGPTFAMARFAEWAQHRAHADGDDPVVRRAFAAVERLFTDKSVQGGNELAAEFVESLWEDPQARRLMGPVTLAAATPLP